MEDEEEKMKFRKLSLSALALLSGSMFLVGCGSNNGDSGDSGKTEITFWAAPNPTQVKFWQEMATEFEKKMMIFQLRSLK